jgi:hypothetical protein
MTDPDNRFTGEPEGSHRWERRFVLPRARAPHRGGLLLTLGILSVVVGAPSVFLFLPALAGLPLALAAYLLADRDLAEMAAGRMDPGGRASAQAAQWCALAGFLLNALGLTLGCIALGVVIVAAPN